MKLKCIIVDDEFMARNFLNRYCEKHGSIDVLGSFPDSESALEFLKSNEVDVIFLDVEMPGYTGFELLDQLLYLPKIVLTTAKTDYAFDAFQYHVTDYLKKPITYNRFLESITKITKQDKIASDSPPREDIFIKSEGKFIRLNFEDILYIESLGDYIKYFTPTKFYITYGTLKSVEEKMNPNMFMKVHRSYIVNLGKINDIQNNSIVIASKVIPISKALKSNVMSKINVG